MSGHRALIALSLVTERRSTPSSVTKGAASPLPARDRPYDNTTTETIRGHVVRVEQTVSTREPMRRTSAGVHVIMRVESGGTIAVHLGPAWFIGDQKLELRSGDTLVGPRPCSIHSPRSPRSNPYVPASEVARSWW